MSKHEPVFIYEIRTFYQDPHRESEHVKFVRTLEEALEHCNDETTGGVDWFDGFFKRELNNQLMKDFNPFVI